MRVQDILAAYDLGAVTATGALGGTAGATMKVHTAESAFVLRRRCLRTSGVERVAFDSRLRRSLRAAGLPLTVPILTRQGTDGVPTDEGFWELTPYVEGREHRHGNRDELASLSRTLAEFHRVGSRIRATADPPPPHKPQAVHACRSGSPESARIDDPVAMRGALQAVLPGLNRTTGRGRPDGSPSTSRGCTEVTADQHGRFLTRDMGEPVEEMLAAGFAGLLD